MDAVKNVKTCAMWTLPPSGRQSDCFCSEGFLFKQAFCSSDKLPVMIIIPFILVTEKQIFLPWKSQPHLKQWCILRGNKCTVFISKSKLWFCCCFPLLINWVLQHQLQSCNNSPTMLIIIALMEVLEQCQQSLLPLFSSSSLYTSVPVWMLLCLRSVLSTHPPNCSWLCSCVWLAHFEQCISALGPCEAQKEATPAACSSAPLRRQSVSQSVSSQYHTVTTPAGRSSFSESQNRLSIHPPRSYTLEVRLGKGANLASDQIPLSPPYFAYSLGCCHPSRGPGPLRERERLCGAVQ